MIKYRVIFVVVSKLSEPFKNLEIFVFLLFLTILICAWKALFLVLVLVDILPFGSGSLDPHIYADPDPENQNVADPTDLDPKHWLPINTLIPRLKSVLCLKYSL